MKKFNKFKKLFNAKFLALNKKRKAIFANTLLFIQKKPFTSFFSVLAVLFVLIVIGNLFFSPKIENLQNTQAPKKVSVYKLGSAPVVTFEGKVEKSGVIKIVSQMGGIVSAINVSEGQEITAGTNILSLSTNYQGGNALSIARQMAGDQYQNAKDTFNTQGDIIGKQKDLINKSNDNANLLRDITTKSASDTKALADLNQTIVNGIGSNIDNLEATNINGSNDVAILQAKEQLSQFQSALVQINSSLSSLELSASSDQPPAQMAQLSHDIAVEQLDLQRKALDMSLELSRLSYNLALVNEANMFPSTPFAGTVDKIFVHIGDNVTPGKILASLSGLAQHVEIVVNIPDNIAKNMSAIEPSMLRIGDSTLEMLPTSVSKDATDGQLYSVIYDIDDSYTSKLTDAAFVTVNIPIGASDTTNEVPFIPLDSVVQTQEEAFVYVVSKDMKATVKKITLGQIQGQFVEVTSGLPEQSQIILDRNVIEGDKVTVVR
jgi:multidrug efflux pump subunit AcrA (membrane-fusion protein)